MTRVSETNDRRKTSISLTDEGKEIVDLCQKEVDKLRDLSWKHLDDSDYDEFNRIIDQIFENFEGYS